jgi:hypothetical protein
MAITNTRTVERIEVYPGDEDPRLMVVYSHTFDDSSDDQLPVTTQLVKHLDRYQPSVDEDGSETQTPTDTLTEDQLVRDICAALWTD